MIKLSLVVVCALFLSIGTARCSDAASETSGHAIKVGTTYQVWFSPDYFALHTSMNTSNQYYIQIDGIDSQNPNWVLIEFPQAPNQSYSSSLAGKRWINLNYVMELQKYTQPSQ